jgi:Tfp pilus assembly protein PilO
MKKPNRDNWIMLGILGAMSLAVALAVYLPQARELERLRCQIVTQKTLLETDAEKVAVVPIMLRQVQAMRSLYKDFDRKLPKQKELGSFLRQISGNLAQERLANQLIEPRNPTKEELFHTLPIVMKFEGNYLSMANFLKRIDRMERVTRVQKMVVQKGDGGEENLNIELQMNIYFTES